MAAQEVTITFKKVFYSTDKLKSRFPNVFPTLIDVGSFKTNFDLPIPNPQGKKLLGKAMKLRGEMELNRLNDKLNQQFDKIFPGIEANYKEDQTGDTKAYGKAKSALDKLNDFVEGMSDSLRADVRIAIAKELKVESKALSTIGSETIVKFALRRGVFTGDNAQEEKNDYSDLATLLKSGKSKWHYCGLAAHGTKAFIAVSRKKQIKRTELKELKSDVGGSAYTVEGICLPSGSNIKIRLLKGGKDVKEVKLKTGIQEQIDKSIRASIECDLEKMPDNLKNLDEHGNPKEAEGATKKKPG